MAVLCSPCPVLDVSSVPLSHFVQSLSTFHFPWTGEGDDFKLPGHVNHFLRFISFFWFLDHIAFFFYLFFPCACPTSHPYTIGTTFPTHVIDLAEDVCMVKEAELGGVGSCYRREARSWKGRWEWKGGYELPTSSTMLALYPDYAWLLFDVGGDVKNQSLFKRLIPGDTAHEIPQIWTPNWAEAVPTLKWFLSYALDGSAPGEPHPLPRHVRLCAPSSNHMKFD
ncbi:hypothetical protein DFH08DRAFT_815889 [Mycena albidolilacea]|uniref:Uncharacterized protein n=1 Tax=Mycena albidolilacea TaxID=1033008 RepID=A0AAD6ZLJ2_9AGAR|nr:hypothetical protein DFH08DRAFT_815889 [Mycena albidolilacea]